MNTDSKTINYTYKGKARTAQVSVVSSHKVGIVYWFHWRNGPPSYISKPDGAWLWCGTRPLTVECEHGEILLALATAIDQQQLK